MVDRSTLQHSPTYALLGHPVTGNPTGAMVEAAWTTARISGTYLSFDVAPKALRDAVVGLRALGFDGAHITKPHKITVVETLDGLTPSATAIGAVNCLKRDGARLLGDNTDGKGFLASLRTMTDPRGKHAVVFGAGGAARAIAVELARAGAGRITVVNRSPASAARVVEILGRVAALSCRHDPLIPAYRLPPDAAIVVNATSVGMDNPQETLPIEWSTAPAGMIAADVVIARETGFLRAAERAGCVTLDGLGMLVEQAVLGLQWWQGIDANRTSMRAALERELGKFPQG